MSVTVPGARPPVDWRSDGRLGTLLVFELLLLVVVLPVVMTFGAAQGFTTVGLIVSGT